MSKEPVLIVATRHDAGSYYTYQWALDLQKELATLKHTCLLLDASDLCRSGTSFADAIDCVKYVVFYGHGEQDEWTALPAGSSGTAKTTPLVDSKGVSVLDGRLVYAGCCHSLVKLGKAYASKFPGGEYVGYQNTFAFETENHEHFRDIVNNSVIAFVKGDSRHVVVAGLQKAWTGLRDAFSGGGILQHRPNAFAAAQYADDNSKRAGCEPP
jgi:hypothetical protein